MIFRAKNGAKIIEKIQIDESEAMKKYTSINHVLAIIKIEDDYLMGWHRWRNDWETFGGLLQFRYLQIRQSLFLHRFVKLFLKLQANL